jgi:hypothetical protein
VSERDRSRGAELRAERIRWRGRSRNMNQASRSMDEHLRKMKDQGSSVLPRRQEVADRSFFGSYLAPSEPHFGAYSDFPNSFSTHFGE